MRFAICLLVAICVTTLFGCGGTIGPPTGLIGRALITVDRGPTATSASKETHRAVLSPADTKSIDVTLTGADPTSGKDLTRHFVLDTSPTAPQIQTFTINRVKAGDTDFTAIFYSTPDANPTSIITTVQKKLNIPTSGTTVPLTTIDQSPKLVVIDPQFTLQVGQTKPLGIAGYTGTDEQSTIIAITPDKVTIQVKDGVNNIRVNGNLVTGLASGTATLSATVDTAPPSADTTIAITSVATAAIAPETATLSVLSTQQFTADVTVASAIKGVTWSVQEGAAGGSITSNGLYTAPGTAGTYHIIATSQADPSIIATATVTVQAGSIDIGARSAQRTAGVTPTSDAGKHSR